MNEYRSSIDFASPDLPLRDDVRRLGALVGDLLVEQVSAAFLDDVEDVRTRAIARRENQAPLSELAEGLAGRTPQQAETMVRAFSTYFQVVNIAERVHRIRRRRDYQRAGTAGDRKSTRLNSSHSQISYAVFCLKKKKTQNQILMTSSPPARRHAAPAHRSEICV